MLEGLVEGPQRRRSGFISTCAAAVGRTPTVIDSVRTQARLDSPSTGGSLACAVRNTYSAFRIGACKTLPLVLVFITLCDLECSANMLFPDRVYVDGAAGSVRFRRAGAPASVELTPLAWVIARRVGRFLERRGLGESDVESSNPAGKPAESGHWISASAGRSPFRSPWLMHRISGARWDSGGLPWEESGRRWS